MLLKDVQCNRNNWPLGIITDVFPSKDGQVRKVKKFKYISYVTSVNVIYVVLFDIQEKKKK